MNTIDYLCIRDIMTFDMIARPSRILQLLNQGHFPAVQKINLSNPRVIEIAGIDAVWLCTECLHPIV